MNTEEFRARRRRFLTALAAHPIASAAGPAAALIFSWPSAVRNGDVDHAYRPSNDLYYLSGCKEPDAALLLLPGHEHESILFVRPKDRLKEIWQGRRMGPEAAKERLGVDLALSIDDLATELPALLRGRAVVFSRLVDGIDPRLHRAARLAKSRTRRSGIAPLAHVELGVVLDGMRLVKDAAEIERLRKAGQTTARAHNHAMRCTKDGVNERVLEGELTAVFMREGAQRHGYTPIVAGGENALVLHYVENDAAVRDGDLVLIDAGAEVDLYTADVTRTYPVSGRFTAEQRLLYELVLAAQKAAIATAVTGNTLRDVDTAARVVLAEGLRELGWLAGDTKELITKVAKKDAPAGTAGTAPLDRYYMHGTSHWLGMDVHDVGPYHDGERPTPLRPGMVLTVEPGIYVAVDDDKAPPPFRGIGIRIEDDILVTEGGNENLSADAVKEIADIEALFS